MKEKKEKKVVMIDTTYIHVYQTEDVVYVVNRKSDRYESVMAKIKKNELVSYDEHGNLTINI